MGAIGALIIHRTDLASYPWSVVENSGAGEDISGDGQKAAGCGGLDPS
jgi:hypothetical protein